MEDVRRVLDSRFERLSKHTDISDNTGEKAFTAWVKKQYKGICGKCGEYGHSSNNCPNCKQNTDNRFQSQTQSQGNNRSRALIVGLPESETRLTRYATGVEDTITPRKNAKASSSASASSTARRSAGTQSSRKKITSRRRMKNINLIMKVLLRLALKPRKSRMRQPWPMSLTAQAIHPSRKILCLETTAAPGISEMRRKQYMRNQEGQAQGRGCKGWRIKNKNILSPVKYSKDYGYIW